MILVSLCLSLTVVIVLSIVALSETLLLSEAALLNTDAGQPPSRMSMIRQDIELTTCPDTAVYIVS